VEQLNSPVPSAVVRPPAPTRVGPSAVGAAVVKIALLTAALLTGAGCGASSGTASAPPPRATAGAPTPQSSDQGGEVPPARVGTPAASQRIRFVPSSIVLPGGSRAPVDPASTVDGLLVVPENVQRVGWWDGGAQAGDPFGALAIAGHVDSAKSGLGFFVRLQNIRVGETITLRDSGHQASYKVTSIRSVPQDALATGTFDQTGPHRLVLITCTGRYDRARGGYERNLVVTAMHVGLAKPVGSTG
jgi:LPXTG-site transpeptidase (sortase) family protein